MENFLNIPWQEEAINKPNAVVRGARGSGKTYCGMRWAIKRLIEGKDVAYLIGSPLRYETVKREFIDVLRCRDLEPSGSIFNVVMVGRGSITFYSACSPLSLSSRRNISQDAIVMDDADNIRRTHLAGYDLNPRAQYYVTGTRDNGVMSSFLKDVWTRLYVEFNQHHMQEAGLMDMTKERWRKWYGTIEDFHSEFGPWRLEGNRNNKFVLDKYDN